MLNVWRNMLKKYGKSDNEHKLLKDSGNLMMSLKCFNSICMVLQLGSCYRDELSTAALALLCQNFFMDFKLSFTEPPNYMELNRQCVPWQYSI